MHILINYASETKHNFKEQILFVLESVRYFLPTNFRQHGVLTPVMLVRRKSPKTFFLSKGQILL